jgi:hypothetical protein
MLDTKAVENVNAPKGFQTSYNKLKALWEVNLDGSKVLEYIYGAEEDPNPSFRLVKTTGGQTITLYRPWDHPWHPGLFFSWKYINGLNFWESMYHGKKNTAVTDSFTPIYENGLGFNQELSYVTYEGETLLKEKRVVRIEEESGGYLIHWQGSFTPSTDSPIPLDRTEYTEKSPWGGYAGLSCRLGRNFLGPVITTDLGVYTAEDSYGKPFKWCDYTGKLDGYIGETKWAGICLMDHSSNLRHPSHMLTYDYKDMQFLSASFLFEKPFVLNSGETLELNYTLYVHDGEANKESLNKIWEKFCG